MTHKHWKLQVIANSEGTLSSIVDLLASVAHKSQQRNLTKALLNGEKPYPPIAKGDVPVRSGSIRNERKSADILILGAGRMCKPVVNYLTYQGLGSDRGDAQIWVTVASLFLEDALEVT
jgi:hypothetical protein